MASTNIDELASALENARVSPSGVTFAGKSLKLDTEEDAQQVTDEIDNCSDLQYLNLEGNTLGVEAAKGIARSLEKHPEFKRALWKDLFTGRMKDEIPVALQYLGNGLVTAGARLTELDMSDNAFGPIGVKGLAALLQSSSCYALEELKLNNNGLGITGGKLLAQALTDCYNSSKESGKPLSLKVFIAGRNRLENEGAKALASVFKMIGTLEEIAMPQNGIYHVGITALSEAFMHNKNLKIINLNDNTIGPRGAEAIAKALQSLQNLKEINFGDCLLKTKGATFLAEGLKDGHVNLEDLFLEVNEIRLQGGMELVKVMSNKTNLKSLNINGNQFGNEGRKMIEKEMKSIGKFNTLVELSENESEDEQSQNEEEEEEEEDDEEDSSDMESDSDLEHEKTIEITELVSFEDFLNSPNASNFIALGDTRDDIILTELKDNGQIDLEKFVPVLMKVSSLSVCPKEQVSQLSLKCCEKLYKELFQWAETNNNSSLVNNTLLVNLGLIKSEDKNFKPSWNLEGCWKSLKHVLDKLAIPELTKDTLKLFLNKELAVSR